VVVPRKFSRASFQNRKWQFSRRLIPTGGRAFEQNH